MANPSLLDEEYDFALLGTSLPLSILSAALAKAGFTILHIDDAEHYGGPWASLTLKELMELKKAHKSSKIHDGIVDIDLKFPSALSDSDEIPTDLEAVNRHFAISLAPTLLPCSGPTIDVLIRSKVASYCTFRLLQQTAVYSNEGRAKDEWPLRTVPSSKEDIFKSKTLSLVDKRRLMKLLQQAVPKRSSEEDTNQNGAESSKAGSSSSFDQIQSNFYNYLTSSDGPGFSARLASDVTYGVALCASANESASSAMHRIQRHIISVGRYGNSAYLVGQYGGAGEMAQCFSRASAVQGGTFVLAHTVKQLEQIEDNSEKEPKDGNQSRWKIGLDGIDGSCKAGCVIGDTDMLHRINPMLNIGKSNSKRGRRQAFGILLLDRGIKINSTPPTSQTETGSEPTVPPPPSPPPETALVVFPPLDDGGDSGRVGSVWALQMGEGTFSCPKGTYIVYLCAALSQEEEELQTADQAKLSLAHAREGIMQLAAASEPEWPNDQSSRTASITPLFECYMVRESSASGEEEDIQRQTEERKRLLDENAIVHVQSSLGNLATSLDDATQQAEELYWLLCGKEGIGKEKAEELRKRQRRAASAYAVGRGLGGLPESEEVSSEQNTVLDFFPVSEDMDES